MKTIQVSIRIPLQLKQIIDEESKTNNRTTTQIIIRHLQDYYQKDSNNEACLDHLQKETLTEVYFNLCKIASKLDLYKSSQAKKIRKSAKKIWALL